MCTTDKNEIITPIIAIATASVLSYFQIIVLPLSILIVLMILDYITGVLKAWYKKEISSKTGIKGIIKKVAYLFSVAVAMTTDYLITLLTNQVGFTDSKTYFIGLIVIIWYIINESISILENTNAIGVPLPKFLKKLLKHFKETIEEKAGEEDEHNQ